MAYKKLVGIGMAVATLVGYTFAFNDYNSKDSLIKQGIDNLKQVALGYKADLERLQGEYNALLGDLNSTQNALEQARIKLQAIYQKITGTEWTEANGDILEFDFESIMPKDGEQFDNNVDGDAIASILGLEAGESTEQIIAAIQDLIATVQSLEQRIVQLEAQVTDLESQIAEYETEQDSLVEEINGLKDKLDQATAEANAIIDGASAEEQAQLDYLNTVLVEMGEEEITDTPSGEENGEEPSGGESTEPTLTEEQLALQEAMNTAWAELEAELDKNSFSETQKTDLKNGDYTIVSGKFHFTNTTATKNTNTGLVDLLNTYEQAKTNYLNSGGSVL